MKHAALLITAIAMLIGCATGPRRPLTAEEAAARRQMLGMFSSNLMQGGFQSLNNIPRYQYTPPPPTQFDVTVNRGLGW